MCVCVSKGLVISKSKEYYIESFTITKQKEEE